MVLLYALRAAIFNPYPSCLSHKLCNHGPVCNRRVPLSKRVVFMLYLRKSQGFYFRSAPSLPPSFLLLFFYLNQMCQVPSFSSILSLSSSSTPFLPSAAVPSHRLPSLSLPPSRYVFTRSLAQLSSLAALFFVGKNHHKVELMQTISLYSDIPPKLQAAAVSDKPSVSSGKKEEKKGKGISDGDVTGYYQNECFFF